ncbi:MAG: hypothetical protein HXK70_02075 [Clostridiales bacterium]|nr:hypothetical protein [Clostridiales bacterium]
MKHLAVIDESKDFLKKIAYNIIYGRKFKKLNIDKRLSDSLIDRRKDYYAKDILKLINKSKNRDEFSTNIIDYLKLKGKNFYANSLLIGNITGKYNFYDFYLDSVEGLNLDAFTKDNEDLIQDLKSHFVEYVVKNNKHKNTFSERMPVGKSLMKDLSQDLNKEEVVKDFDRALNGEKTNDDNTKPRVVSKYLMKTIGVYTKEDIKENFDFVLYDIDRGDKKGIDERRRKYFLHSNLSNNQLRKIDEAKVLKLRLQKINGEVSEQLISRLNNIENNLDENITELEDIYSDYEVLYREDLIEHLFVPQNDVTIIENVSDLKPQLIHQFIRDPKKFRKLEIEKIKEKIIKERFDKNDSQELTEDEQERLNELMNRVDENLNQYKVNYSTDSKGKKYTDASGFDEYMSDTSNQISASVFEGKEFVVSSHVGIVGVGFNEETLTTDAIAISSNSYKTTNKGLNNLEYNEENEFEEMSSTFSELIKSKGQSEIVMHRRGMDFDTKASYIFATIDSSNKEQTAGIMNEIEQIRKKEGLKVVIYDKYKIKESMEKDIQLQDKEEKEKDEEDREI